MSKPWVKTTMAPGSQVVTDYYNKAGLWPYLEKLASTWSVTAAPMYRQLKDRCRMRSARPSTIAICRPPAVLSGNRNFEGRINPDVKMNYLASAGRWSSPYRAGGHDDFDFEVEHWDRTPMATTSS